MIKTKEDFEKNLSDESWSVRLVAVRSEFFGPEHMHIALNDEHGVVRITAVKSKHFNTYHYIRYLDNEYDLIKYVYSAV